MPKHGKKYRIAAEKVDPLKQYPPAEGVKLVKETAFAGFDESVELHIRTGLDPRHAIQSMRLLSEIARSGTLVIASLHDLTLAARYPDRFIILVDGAVMADEQTLTAELIHRAFGVSAVLTGTGDSRSFTLLSTVDK